MLHFALQTMITNKNYDNNLYVVTWPSPAASVISKI